MPYENENENINKEANPNECFQQMTNPLTL